MYFIIPSFCCLPLLKILIFQMELLLWKKSFLNYNDVLNLMVSLGECHTSCLRGKCYVEKVFRDFREIHSMFWFAIFLPSARSLDYKFVRIIHKKARAVQTPTSKKSIIPPFSNFSNKWFPLVLTKTLTKT